MVIGKVIVQFAARREAKFAPRALPYMQGGHD
jgi:hypothetical protein